MNLFNIFRRANASDTVKSSTPVALSGGDGSSEDEAIIVHTTDRLAGIAAEFKSLNQMFGVQGEDWDLQMQLLKERNGRNYDVFKLQFKDGSQNICVFDITEYR